jgi:hypothetical protein
VSSRRLALVTDAWHPQTNGVVNTLSRLVNHLEAQGTEVLVVSPENHRTWPLPSYPEIKLACDPWRAIPRLQRFRPDAVHVATEGPLGLWASHWLRRRRLRFTTSFHTRFPEYLRARFPIPLAIGYQRALRLDQHVTADPSRRTHDCVARADQGRRVRIHRPGAWLERPYEAVVQARELRLGRILQLQISELLPHGQGQIADERLLDPAEPAHERGQQPPGDPVG